MKQASIEVPVKENILQFTAELIFKQYTAGNNDCSDLYVLLPDDNLVQPFNEALCRLLSPEQPVIIPPWAGTLRAWTKLYFENRPLENQPARQVISEHARQLLFIEALQQSPELFDEENKWQVSQTLLSLFDELELNQKIIFDSQEQWQQQLQQAYGIDHPHQHMLYESKLVYTLWHAWKKQLDDSGLIDETGDYIQRLKTSRTIIGDKRFICIGQDHYSKSERAFIQHLVDSRQCQIIDAEKTVSGNHIKDNQPENAVTAFISETFINESDTGKPASFKQRTQKYRQQFTDISSEAIPFTTFLAPDEETQVRAIDTYVRLQRLNGKQNIAVISEDRKLSRRLRALLERADIQLQDRAGWSLATTQAATFIERWLECIEENFSAYPLLDCLKSPFINLGENSGLIDRESFKKNIYRFEHDLIFHENVSADIEQYKSRLKQRLKRLSHWPASTYDELLETLDQIKKIATPQLEFYNGNNKKPFSVFLEMLTLSMQQLGVRQGYQNDDAGLVILDTLDTLKQGTHYADPILNWSDCRVCLGMALESQHFTPPMNNSGVQLMTLDQADYLAFDCVVLAAAESQHFPGSADSNPIFNQAVRASLGLETWEKQRAQRHEKFNRLLLNSPVTLITACDEENGEKKPVSPWLELLMNFYQLVFEQPSDDLHLVQLLSGNTEVINCDTDALPVTTDMPAPSIPSELIPGRTSASAYQRLINCPYQYFAADGLKLKPLEELSDELKKSDYGERIHLILQCFHNGHERYGKAFSNPLTTENRKQAERHLEKLSEKIFFSDTENNVLHRSWLYRWKKHIPAYISWQLQQQIDWSIYRSEEMMEASLNTGDDMAINIYGRLDRIDLNREHRTHAIIDYKTGRTPAQEDIDIGENVQLSIYALLDLEASEVSYLSVDSPGQKVETKASLSGELLDYNREQNLTRLGEIFTGMKHDVPLHAWGDDLVCGYCNFYGICRKQQWSENNE